jgi:hypothetical protein
MPQRIQRKRVKGWRMPEGAVYVGRPSIYGNPFRIGVGFCGPTIRRLHTPREITTQFRLWISQETLHPMMWDRELIVAHTPLRAALMRGDLRGKDLACWCPIGQYCHADVLLQLANEETP